MGPWLFLSFAIVMEIAGTFLLKLSEGFTKYWWGWAAIACYTGCFWLLAPALKDLPVGVVYALWAGIGIIGASILGLVFFQERLALLQYGFIALILVGAVGLRVTTQA
ncbi:MAG: multidrug efflux SMR transporter [Pseudomonadota bacterium]